MSLYVWKPLKLGSGSRKAGIWATKIHISQSVSICIIFIEPGRQVPCGSLSGCSSCFCSKHDALVKNPEVPAKRCSAAVLALARGSFQASTMIWEPRSEVLGVKSISTQAHFPNKLRAWQPLSSTASGHGFFEKHSCTNKDTLQRPLPGSPQYSLATIETTTIHNLGYWRVPVSTGSA